MPIPNAVVLCKAEYESLEREWHQEGHGRFISWCEQNLATSEGFSGYIDPFFEKFYESFIDPLLLAHNWISFFLPDNESPFKTKMRFVVRMKNDDSRAD